MSTPSKSDLPIGKDVKSIAYIVSQYPMLSMIFIIREVIQLKALGFDIEVASVNPSDRGTKGLTDYEADEASNTYYIKTHGIKGALRAHFKTLVSSPKAYVKGWVKTFSLARGDFKALAYNTIYFTEALMLGVWMKERGHTHLHAHLGSQAATIGMFTKQVFNVGFSITVHGPDEFYNAPGQFLTEKVAASDFICCISNFARSQLMKLSPYEDWKKLEVSRLGVDPETFAAKKFNPNPEMFEVICVGRLTSAKGQHILVDAMNKLVTAGRKIQLRIVGDGEDRASLEEHVRSLNLTQSIIFEGSVNQDRIRDLYSQADIFSIPSFAEGIPVVLMEAMSMEIPVVTTRITGIPEMIRDGIDGLLTAPSDVDELAAALERLMDDTELREMLAKNGRKRILEHYDLARNVDRLAGIFQRRLS